MSEWRVRIPGFVLASTSRTDKGEIALKLPRLAEPYTLAPGAARAIALLLVTAAEGDGLTGPPVVELERFEDGRWAPEDP